MSVEEKLITFIGKDSVSKPSLSTNTFCRPSTAASRQLAPYNRRLATGADDRPLHGSHCFGISVHIGVSV